jgi:hypothetical protein
VKYQDSIVRMLDQLLELGFEGGQWNFSLKAAENEAYGDLLEVVLSETFEAWKNLSKVAPTKGNHCKIVPQPTNKLTV